jgi:DNA-binding CsgD family transcriptional regulator
VEDPSIPGKNALMAVITLGLVLARRDDAAQGPLLERAVREVDLTLSPGWVVPGRLALVEAAWLDGRLADAREAITPIGEYAAAADAWERGAVETWRVRLGLPPQGLVDVASPYRRSLDGDWRGAWKEWSDLGCPYDAVMALADSDEEADLRQALEEVQHLEAPATERVLRAKLRAMGATSVPAGPRPSTRANAAGLTGREQDVLALLVDGLTNAEIAGRLVLSVKTVDHHVSAVLGKLGVSSRKDVAAAAARLGLVEAVGGSR